MPMELLEQLGGLSVCIRGSKTLGVDSCSVKSRKVGFAL